MNFLLRHINNRIMAFKSTTGLMPNVLLINKWFYEDLVKEEIIVQDELICDNIDGTNTQYSFKILVCEHIKKVEPLKINNI